MNNFSKTNATLTIFSVFFLTSVLLFSSCTHSVKSETFFLPEWDTSLASLSHWEITFTKENESKTLIVKNAKTFSLPIEKSSPPVAIIAHPVTLHQCTPPQQNAPSQQNAQSTQNATSNTTSLSNETSLFFKPAGCVFPFSSTLSWEEGFASTVLHILYTQAKESGTGYYLSKFNWQKFILMQKKKQSESLIPYDPWKTDIQTICKQIARRQFNLNSLSMKNTGTILCDQTISSIPRLTYLIPNYIPSYYKQKSTNLLTIKKEAITSFLTNGDNLLHIKCTKDGNPTLEISPLPLYTKE
ncbi:MAG: hypothetical protein IKI31_03480 [Treponema sp.]|nr:hypothetical protein [Treponema sp.]